MIIILSIFIIFILICIISWIADTHRFVVRNYKIDSDRISKNLRIVMISDLHNKVYGKDNEAVLDAIQAAHPDMVILAGDMCNGLKNNDFTPAISLIKELYSRYPVYYGMGNHEYRLMIYPDVYGTMWDEYSQELSSFGAHVMDNERAFLPDYNLDIASVSIERHFYKRFRKLKPTVEDLNRYLGEARSDAMQLLIAHNPEFFDSYASWGANLTLSGHVHGGIMRLPVIGGIVSPRLVVYPKYSDGLYTKDDKKMIVGCGLGTHTIHIRVFNPAEISVIDIQKGE